MRIVCVGGGPGGLYLAVLLKRADPTREVVVYERNPPDRTFGFGVVFSDATLGNIEAADPETYAAIAARFSHWDDIDVHLRGEVFRSTGHGFAGMGRQTLLEVLQRRCAALGVEVHHETEITDEAEVGPADLIVACDGLNSRLRTKYAEHFQPDVDPRPNRFIWLGTTRRFPAFTFDFVEDDHGLWRLHAYNYDRDHSTVIVETTEAAWRSAGLADADEATSAAVCARLFGHHLDGHPLLTHNAIWRQFPTVTNARWSHGNIVLLGDAAHTAHFSIGSGTKLAMEDAIALAEALDAEADVSAALARYEAARRPDVESTQRSAAVSLRWFEETERYFQHLEPRAFVYSLLTRSLRINHTNLRLRDLAFATETERWFARRAGVAVQAGRPAPPPMFTPFTLRDLTLTNRVVVSPMCMYSATEGTVGDFHLVHLGARADGGAGLVLAEMTDVSAEGRITPGCAGLYDDAHTVAWRRIVDYVHGHTGAALGVQLGHAGRKGATRLMWEGMDQPLPADQAWPLLAPSALPYLPHSSVPKPMDRADMDQVVAQFVAATQRADAAGFDLLEIHLAHGYLLASFLSPITNRRTDAYGGTLSRRMRFPLEVFEAARAAWPAHKPISARISASDWMEGGTTAEDAVILARALKAAGCDLVDVSTGQTDPAARPEYGRLYQTPFAERVRLEADVPTMTVGGISSYGDVNAILAAGRADLCALARVHLFDPAWTRHAAFEQGWALPWRPQYPLDRYVPRVEWSPRGAGG